VTVSAVGIACNQVLTSGSTIPIPIPIEIQSDSDSDKDGGYVNAEYLFLRRIMV